MSKKKRKRREAQRQREAERRAAVSAKKARQQPRKDEPMVPLLKLLTGGKKKEETTTDSLRKLSVCIVDNGYYVQVDYIDWINQSDFFTLEDVPAKADILLFTGGPDVAPRLYGQLLHSRTMPEVRRDTHDQIMFGMGKDKFKVGICRGAQILNVLSGGSMIQHVFGGAHKKPHDLRLCQTGNIIYNVPSTHHQLMIPSKRVKDRTIIATAWDATDSFKTLVSPIDKHLPRVMEPQKASFFKAYTNPDFNPATDDAEIIMYRNTHSLCIQSHPEKTSCPLSFRKYCESLIYSNARAFLSQQERNKAS